MSGTNNLCRKVEDVWLAYLRAAVPTATLYRAHDQVLGGMDLPRIEIVCPRSAPMTDAIDASAGIPNRSVFCDISVHSPPFDDADGLKNARETHDELAGAVMDALHVTTLTDELDALGVEGVGIMQVDLPAEECTVEDGHFVTRYTFNCLAYSKE